MNDRVAHGPPGTRQREEGAPLLFFSLSDGVLVVVLFALIFGATAGGLIAGRRLHDRSDTLREPIAATQAALLGFMALVLAFGLTLAVGRYQDRRATVVEEANAIGTTYLRAQTLAEPIRSRSLGLLVRYTDASIRLAKSVPDTAAAREALADGAEIQRGAVVTGGSGTRCPPAGCDSVPRLYVDSLNTMIDSQTTRASALNNRVPTAVLVLEVVGAAVAMALLAFYLGLSGRGFMGVAIASLLVTLMLLVTFDLDRPTRGLITVPATPLTSLRASMALRPAAAAPDKYSMSTPSGSAAPTFRTWASAEEGAARETSRVT